MPLALIDSIMLNVTASVMNLEEMKVRGGIGMVRAPTTTLPSPAVTLRTNIVTLQHERTIVWVCACDG